jgi:HlyD family secretion protein
MEQMKKFFTAGRAWALMIGVLVVAVGLVGAMLLIGRPAVEAQQSLNLPTYQPQGQPQAQGAPARRPTVSAPVAVAQAPAVNSGSVETTSGQSDSGALIYSGDIQAAQKAPVAVEVNGRVLNVQVDVGAQVKAGDVLLQIDSTTLEAQRAQALAGLKAAQAQMDQLQLGPEASDVAAARAGVDAANAAYQKAVAGPTQQDKDIAEAQLRQAQAAVKQAQAAYDQVSWAPNIGALPQSAALEQATLQVEAAQAQYDKIVQGATQDVIDGAYAQVAAANAKLSALQTGAKQPQIDAAQAQIEQAETGLYLAQLQVNKATLRSPVDGVISKVNTEAGATVAAGTPVFEILSNKVEIVLPVEEYRLAQVHIGQAATITVAAYPGRTFAGEIATIAPALDPSTRTAQVTIRPTGDAGGLTPGMYATVTLQQ